MSSTQQKPDPTAASNASVLGSNPQFPRNEFVRLAKESVRKVAAGKAGQSIAAIAWRLPLVRLISSGYPTVLVYHGVARTRAEGAIDAETFERHISLLAKNFECVSSEHLRNYRRRADRNQVLLTFDDGLRNNFDVAKPILLKYRVPALFFISSRHAERGRYLWFSYLRALKLHFPGDTLSFRGAQFDMRPEAREASVMELREFLLGLRPHPSAMYRAIEDELPPLEDFMTPAQLSDECEGMTGEQVADLTANPLFSVGCHTVDHPYLPRCEPTEMCRQISENKSWLEAVSRVRCDAIAYPLGDYDAAVVELCRKHMFSQGYALSPLLRSTPEFEIPRVGIYSNSLEFLGLKAQWGNLLRAARLAVG
jgi:peptidoglycan/xylan/chitin deacetylase (PgdA/CDA1 family)